MTKCKRPLGHDGKCSPRMVDGDYVPGWGKDIGLFVSKFGKSGLCEKEVPAVRR